MDGPPPDIRNTALGAVATPSLQSSQLPQRVHKLVNTGPQPVERSHAQLRSQVSQTIVHGISG